MTGVIKLIESTLEINKTFNCCQRFVMFAPLFRGSIPLLYNLHQKNHFGLQMTVLYHSSILHTGPVLRIASCAFQTIHYVNH